MQNSVEKKPVTPTTETQANRENSPTEASPELLFTSSAGVKLLQRAVQNPNPQTLTPAVIQRLQRQYGNRFVTRLMQRVMASPPPHPERRQDEEESLPPATTGIAASPVEIDAPIQRLYKYAGKVAVTPRVPVATPAPGLGMAGGLPGSSPAPARVMPMPSATPPGAKPPLLTGGVPGSSPAPARVVSGPSATPPGAKPTSATPSPAPAPAPAPLTIDIWQDGARNNYRLTKAALHASGILLGFTSLSPLVPNQTFIAPAEIGTKKFYRFTPAGVEYGDPSKSGDVINVNDLNSVTGYKDASAKSSFTAIAPEKFQSNYHRTSFLARVSLVPVKNTAGGELFKSSEVWVEDVKVSDDRPPTKFGSEGQRSHTVAWSLLRAALQNMGHQTLDKFLKILSDMSESIDLPTTSPASATAAQAVKDKIKTGTDQIGDAHKSAELFFWQRLASDYLGQYVHLYQLSESATYADAQAVGHGEPGHMATLRAAEKALKEGKVLAVPEVALVATAAVGLLDYKSRLGAKIIAQVLHHWMNDLALAFPLVAKTYRVAIITKLGIAKGDQDKLVAAFTKDPTAVLATIGAKSTTQTIETDRLPEQTALEKANQSSFVANVYVVPQKSVAKRNLVVGGKDGGVSQGTNTLALGHYKATDLKIEQVDVADDRPNTRFGNLQRSHTVAWTLVRRHLINFGGQNAAALLNFILNELPILQDDIDSPLVNPKIPFDAPTVAAKLHADVMKIASNTDGFPLHQWQTRLSELVETYVTLYQLSRSATYSKEERPKGHGESSALGTLDKIEAALATKADMVAKKAYTDTNQEEICDAAIKLVDAAVATGTLQPTEWQLAIQHWLKLLGGKYPLLMGIPTAAAAIQKSVTVAEPSEELLAGYKKGLTPRDKLLINLYESARYEARYTRDTFVSDLRSSLRLWLAELPAPKSDKWSAIVKGIKLDVNKLKPYALHLAPYFERGGGRRAGVLLDVPKQEAITKVILDVKKYFDAITADKDAIVAILMKYIASQAEKDPASKAFVTGNAVAITEKLDGALKEALDLSSATTMDNYQAWYQIIHNIKPKDEVNYHNLMAVIEAQKAKAAPKPAGK